ncbi:ectoine/hydroxyectoine ABC transporter ATP-binding protein EhuA [Rhodobacteraceae bacterium RKSG542]|uniref:ectoine/hydroxyectoine ABC transporter ATP-binding protein EhuA n=1 Tax=Pseudovibrio flavus TaxID=2529854 RepID=UPI0012BB5004|nr:ectoine/hydroxyectoine ABC transporter ATP-binding protein EhuA [Pseudovibrio flavus]MTI17502.1 ectoine/hydroxyectoine ABC transporter ATP-binding protein EhuA [Pseudovibrio flavus]
MVQPIIDIQSISKCFGDLTVLDNLSFQVAPGEKLALIGPSGSGKTTILRVLMTLETLTSGHVLIEDEQLWHMERGGKLVDADETHLHKMRNSIGMVFQHFNLFPHKTVLENVTLALRLVRGVAKKQADERALELLDLVGLADKRDQKPASLSGGQKQRVAIARALALEPKIMLFDEVTSALDPELVDEVLNVMRRLGEETDMTMLLVTHEMGFARDFADRVLFFDKGRIIESGPPEQIFTDPQEERTRTFLRKVLSAGVSRAESAAVAI